MTDQDDSLDDSAGNTDTLISDCGIEPCSALTASIRPRIDLSQLHDDPDFIIDEFGFRVKLTDANRHKSVGRHPDRTNLQAWLNLLEFSYTHTLGVADLDELNESPDEDPFHSTESSISLWQRLKPTLVHSPKLTALVLEGIPHQIRPHIWSRLVGALDKANLGGCSEPSRWWSASSSSASTGFNYADIVQLSASDQLPSNSQIEKDLRRTVPNNVCFASPDSTGISRLRRILRALAWLYVDVCYCQGMGVIAAYLLLCLEEEAVFWTMAAIVENLLPPSYYSSNSLLGVQADQAVLCHLLPLYLPKLASLLKDNAIELPLITLQWFLTLFAGICQTRVTFRIWDVLFYDGSTVLFRISLALLKLKEHELLAQSNNAAQIMQLISELPESIDDPEQLIHTAYSFESEHLESANINFLRRHYLAQLLADESIRVWTSSSPETSSLSQFRPPKQYLTKRQLKRPKLAFSNWFNLVSCSREAPGLAVVVSPTGPFPRHSQSSMSASSVASTRSFHHHNGVTEVELCDPKFKNIRQTELLVDLKQAILDIVHHFRQNDPECSVDSTTGQADYSTESHGKDLENYIQAFEPDELAFSRNDIITLINVEDEHCWVGELNGLQGWFPAKCVQVLDERGRRYSPAGDDAVNGPIADLARGSFYKSLLSIFMHGLKKPRLLGDSGCHPWLFIEEAAQCEVQRDFTSVYSRLMLCKTFRLDEEGKVLSPEEVLYRTIHAINASHNRIGVHSDAKFRALICYGLNEQLLHLWLETLCSSVKVVEKWYSPWSYLRSPGWVQIKCELRLLTQFSFNLSTKFEVDNVKAINSHSSATNGDEVSRRRPSTTGRSKPKRRPASTKMAFLACGSGNIDSSESPSSMNGTDASSNENANGCYSTQSAGDMLVKYHLFSWEL